MLEFWRETKKVRNMIPAINPFPLYLTRVIIVIRTPSSSETTAQSAESVGGGPGIRRILTHVELLSGNPV